MEMMYELSAIFEYTENTVMADEAPEALFRDGQGPCPIGRRRELSY